MDKIWALCLGVIPLFLGCRSVKPKTPMVIPLLEKATTEETEPVGKEKQSIQSFSRAFGQAQRSHPLLQAATKAVEAAKGEQIQAGLWPNPELEADVESIGGRNELKGLESIEGTLLLSQEIPLTGQLSAQKKVAYWEYKIALWKKKLTELELWRRVRIRFFEALFAQERLKLYQKLVDIAKKVRQSVAAQVRAGKVSPLEERRATLQLARVQIQLQKAEKLWEAARGRLAATIGVSKEKLPRKLQGDFFKLMTVPPAWGELVRLLESHPLLRQMDLEIARQKAVVQLESARALSDPTIRAGAQYYREAKSHAFTFGFGWPLPLWNRNQGAIQAAKANLEKLYAERQALKLDLLGELYRLQQRLAALWKQVKTMQREVLPQAEINLEATQLGYQQGKFNYLQLLDVQRTFFEIQTEYLEVLLEYHTTKAEIEAFLGVSLDQVSQQNRESK